MLWEKEPNGQLYVDIFAFGNGQALAHSYEISRFNCMGNNSTWNKSDTDALRMRKEGNQYFARSDWRSAISCYNESLSCAEPGSENISLAYANRSACFFHLEKYKKCLVDIGLARKSGYPARLMSKLDQREEDCRRCIQQGQQENDDFGLKLDYESDLMFPCMADVLEIGKNAEGNLVMKAKEDIEVGKVVAVDKAYTAYSQTRFAWQCNICLKSAINLIPCKKCTTAMFCSDECQNHPLHEIECGLQYSKIPILNNMMMHKARSIFRAINLFTNATELMEFVVEAVRSDPKEIPESLTKDISKYRAFLKLPSTRDDLEDDRSLFVYYGINKMLMELPKIKAMFNTKKHQRFLIHLIAHHSTLISNNSGGTTFKLGSPIDDECYNVTSSRIGLLTPYFRHSCAPNTYKGDRDGNDVYITIRPVQKGENLMCRTKDLVTPLNSQQQKLTMTVEPFVCANIQCIDSPLATPEQRNQLKLDPLYKVYSKDYDGCVALLQKYGGMWCYELIPVLKSFEQQLNSRFAQRAPSKGPQC